MRGRELQNSLQPTNAGLCPIRGFYSSENKPRAD